MTDQVMPNIVDHLTAPEPKLTLVPTREPMPANKYIDHKRLENVADAILRLTTSEFKTMCSNIHAVSVAVGNEPRDVENCMFEFANRVMDEAKEKQD